MGSWIASGVGCLACIAFALLHPAGDGIVATTRGAVPLAGPANYCCRLGLLGVPAQLAQADAPLAFGISIDAYGAGTLFRSGPTALLH